MNWHEEASDFRQISVRWGNSIFEESGIDPKKNIYDPETGAPLHPHRTPPTNLPFLFSLFCCLFGVCRAEFITNPTNRRMSRICQGIVYKYICLTIFV